MKFNKKCPRNDRKKAAFNVNKTIYAYTVNHFGVKF